jgi:hypothetical protein
MCLRLPVAGCRLPAASPIVESQSMNPVDRSRSSRQTNELRLRSSVDFRVLRMRPVPLNKTMRIIRRASSGRHA